MSRRIAVLLTPTRSIELWRTAFRNACGEMGFAYIESAPSAALEGDALLLSEDPQQGMAWNADSWHVVGSAAEDALAASLAWVGDIADATRYVANRLATADMLCRRAAATIGFGPVQNIPNFGQVAIPKASAPEEVLEIDKSWLEPLATLYATIPVDSRARADFGNAWFSFPTCEDAVDGRIQLQGKARSLLAGPTLDIGPGRWALTIRLEYRNTSQPTALRVRLSGHSATKDLVEELGRPGIYELTMEQNISTLASVGVELHLERAALLGELRILRCDIRHLSGGRGGHG